MLSVTASVSSLDLDKTSGSEILLFELDTLSLVLSLSSTIEASLSGKSFTPS